MNVFSDILLAPFKLVWELLPPEWAIPVSIVAGAVFVFCFGNMMLFLLFGSEQLPETNTEPEREYRFYPEDFEQ